MDIKRVSEMLNDETIITIYNKDSLEEDRKQDENYYMLKFNGHLWEFSFVACEKNSVGTKEILKTFSDEASASKYYYLFELSRFYFYKNILSFETQNKDINIGETDCKIENLKEAFNRLHIGNQYFSFDGVKKEHSIYLNEVNSTESSIKFIGNNYKEIFETPVMDNWLAYYSMYKFVYYLYLLDRKNEELLVENKIDSKFSDKDYNTFIS